MNSGKNNYPGRPNRPRGAFQMQKNRLKDEIAVQNISHPPMNTHIPLGGTGSRRHKHGQRNAAGSGPRKCRRQRGCKNQNQLHPIESYRRRKRKKQFQGTVQSAFEHCQHKRSCRIIYIHRCNKYVSDQPTRHADQGNPYQETNLNDPAANKDDYTGGGFNPSQPLENNPDIKPIDVYTNVAQNQDYPQHQDLGNANIGGLKKPYNNFNADMDSFMGKKI